MKKNIIIACLAVTTILSMTYAFVQHAAAERSKAEAIENHAIAIKAQQELQRVSDQQKQQVDRANEMYLKAVAENEAAKKKSTPK